ncbi:hypothetical protein IV417_02700 [Alphaproteobacteria bacterium KMM 3653]|uniref:D-galactarate dehydratase n=1 Tax=Harenicola maris TaxID=2841044 RepID=A0AAP2CKV2_9RHOB|nr:hypothetical protein [Harenicola maris]
MKHVILTGIALIALGGCTAVNVEPGTAASAEGQVRPVARPGALDTQTRIVAAPPPVSARTEEQFDTTTAEERAAAAAVPAAPAEKRLGVTIASLGDPTDPGFWAETPLVSTLTQGRLEYPGSGKSVQVELRPISGPAGAGSRVSLPAFRVLEAPLTALPELVVYSGG